MRASSQIVIGVDVGGPKKGFHAVALRGAHFLSSLATREPIEVAAWCRRLGASAVGIDGPCSWSRTGRARRCERELAEKGIFTFATPGRSKGERHPFYRWMRRGMELYSRLQPHYTLFDGKPSPSGPICFETFPHAVACVLAGRLLSAGQKRRDRLHVLRAAGLPVDVLSNIDMVDAALCALTARYVLAGRFASYGDVKEGFIVVPLRRGK